MRKQRILYFLGKGSYFLSHRLPTAYAARDLGYEIHVMAIDDNVFSQFAKLGFVLHERVLQSNTTPIFSTFLGFFQLLYLSFTVQPKIVHIIGLKSAPVGLLMGFVCWKSRFIFSINGLGFLFSRLHYTIFHRLARAFIMKGFTIVSKLRNIEVLFQNDDDRRTFESFGALKNIKHHLVRGSGVDTELYSLMPLPKHQVTFGVACRMIQIKGVEDVINAFSELLDEGVPIQLLLAGEVDQGNPASLTKELLQASCNRNGMDWLGFVEDMTDFWSRCHVAILPSHGGEGVPMALLVAASMGRAIVTSDTNGNRNLVVEGKNGFLCRPADVTDLKQKILSCLDVDLYKFGRTSRKIIINSHMDSKSIKQALKKIYRG